MNLLGQIRISSSSAHGLVESTRKVSQCEIRTNELRVNVRLQPCFRAQLFSEPGHRPQASAPALPWLRDRSRKRRRVSTVDPQTACSRHLLRKNLNFQKENQSQHPL